MTLILKQSTAVTVQIGPFVLASDGDTNYTTALVQADIRLSKNGNTPTQKNSATGLIHQENGMYPCALSTTDTNTTGRLVLTAHVATTLNVRHEYQVITANAYNAIYDTTSPGPVRPTTPANTLDVTATGEAGIDWGNIGNKTATANLSGTTTNLVNTTTTNTDMVGTNGAALASVCTEARLANLDAAGLEADVAAVKVDTGNIETDTQDIQSRLPTTLTGTADSGDSTSLTDAALTQADDYWNGSWLQITNGTLDGQVRLITDFANTGGVLTVSPAFTAAVATHTYKILPAAHVGGVQGDVTGNVVGTVASVVGAVDSVTNNVGGNVTGSVGSVLGNVDGTVATVTTVTTCTTNTDMRGTDNAALASVCTVGRLQELDAGNLIADVAAIQSDTDDIQNRLPASLIGGQMDSVVGGGVTGTADSGSSTTLVDAVLTQANDYWNGSWLQITNGTLSDQVRLITDFDAASDTLTVAPAFTAAVSTHTYKIIPAAHVGGVQGNVTGSAGSVTGAVGSVAGNVDGTVASVTGAVGSVTGNVGGNVVGTVASVVGAVDSVTNAVGSVTAAVTVDTINANVINAASLAADAGTELADAILKRDMGSVSGASSRSPLNALRLLRNKHSIAAGTLTVTEEDDATSAWTAVLVSDATADPITSVDPVEA